jgi:hypothetical protein
MRSLAIAILLATAALCGCGRKQSTRVADVTQPATLSLSPARSQGDSVHGLALRIHGRIDGAAMISASVLPTQHVAGAFEIQYSGDYYETHCAIQYSPENVRSGNVTVDYEFRTAR